jgi:hypothetical protein
MKLFPNFACIATVKHPAVSMATGTVDNSKLTFQINRRLLFRERWKIMEWRRKGGSGINMYLVRGFQNALPFKYIPIYH